MLLLGRVMGGLATSLLCSTFESWYVHQHLHHYNFPSHWLANTFSLATYGRVHLILLLFKGQVH